MEPPARCTKSLLFPSSIVCQRSWFCISCSFPGHLLHGCALKDLVSIANLESISPVELFNLSKAKKEEKRILVEVMKQIHDDRLVGSSLFMDKREEGSKRA